MGIGPAVVVKPVRLMILEQSVGVNSPKFVLRTLFFPANFVNYFLKIGCKYPERVINYIFFGSVVANRKELALTLVSFNC